MMPAESVIEWMREAYEKKLRLEVRSTGRIEDGHMILSVNSISGDVGEITIEEFAKAKGEFLRWKHSREKAA